MQVCYHNDIREPFLVAVNHFVRSMEPVLGVGDCEDGYGQNRLRPMALGKSECMNVASIRNTRRGTDILYHA